jgi:hypothetical protein
LYDLPLLFRGSINAWVLPMMPPILEALILPR